jgi:hypothetical protein
VPKLTIPKVRKLLLEYYGNMAAVARACDVTRSAVLQFVDRHHLREVIDEAHETRKDDAESAFWKNVVGGHVGAQIFF